MIRLLLLTTLVVAGCHPNSAEIRCGKTLCGPNQRCESQQLICVLDEAPQLIVTEPRVGSLIAGETLTLSGSVRDDNGASTLELSLDEGKSWVKVPKTSDRFTARVALPALDYQPLGLTLRAHDSLQQASVHRVGITVDNLAPTLSLAAPAEGALLNVAWFASVAKVSGLAADGSGLSSLTVDVGAGDVVLTPGGDLFAYDWVPTPTEDGVAHTVRVTAVDLAGNKTSVSRQVKVDVVAPQIGFTVPAVDALLGSAFFLGGGLVHGTVTPGAKVTADFGAGMQPATVSAGQWSAAFAPVPGVDFKPQPLTVIATDDAGNLARATRMTTVDLVAPVLTFTSPVQGARLNASHFHSSDDVKVEWTVADGDPQVVVRDGTRLIPNAWIQVATSPTDNPKSYGVSLSVQDRAGNTSQAQLSFAVDRMRPTVTTRTPAVEGRNVSTTAAIDFSEEVTGAPGLVLTPAAPTAGTWTTPKHFEISGLPADSVFSSIVGAVTDAFGNPLATSAAVKFHTSPTLPSSGTTLMTDVARFKVAADADGVLTLFTRSPATPATFRWVRVNPKTGVLEDNRAPWQPVVGGDFTEFAAYGESQVNADLSARRVSAATTLLPWTIIERRSHVREDDGIATSEIGMVGVVATRPFSPEGTALADVGFLKWSSGAVAYTRTGMPATLGLAIGSPTGMGFASDHWEAIEVRNQVFKRRAFGCSTVFPSTTPTCSLGALGQWTDVATNDAASYAIADACSVYVYNSSNAKRVIRFEPYAPSCAGRTCPVSRSKEVSTATELRVASDRRESNTFVTAGRNAAGAVQLARLPLTLDCEGGSYDVGAAVAVPVGAPFEPVSLGGKPALVYVDTGNVLKVYVP